MAEGPPTALSVVVHSGAFARIHYALVMAASQAALGRGAILFFTMEAVAALRRPAGTGADAAWRSLPAGEGGRAVDGCRTAGELDDRFRERGTATFEELVTSAAEIGVQFWVCEMGLKALGIKADELRDDLGIEVSGMVSLLRATPAGAALVFV